MRTLVFLDNSALGKLDREARRHQSGGGDDGQDPRHDRAVLQQQRRQVHRKPDVSRPIQGTPACAAEDRFGHLPDERGLFRNGYEAGGRNDTQFGVQPAGKHLEFHQRSRLEVHDRLIIRDDLPRRERPRCRAITGFAPERAPPCALRSSRPRSYRRPSRNAELCRAAVRAPRRSERPADRSPPRLPAMPCSPPLTRIGLPNSERIRSARRRTSSAHDKPNASRANWPLRSRQQRVGRAFRESTRRTRPITSSPTVRPKTSLTLDNPANSSRSKAWQCPGVVSRDIDGAYRLGEVLAIRQPGQRIIASRRMSLTLKAGQLFACITERARNAEKHHPRQNERQRRKRHHTDDEAPSLKTKWYSPDQPKTRKTLLSRPLSLGPGQRKYGQQGQRKNRAYTCTRQGHRNSSPSSLTDGARTIAMSRFSLETARDGE